MIRWRRAAAYLSVLCALLAAAPAAASGRHPLAPPAPPADDGLARALARGDLSEAQYALERARSLFRLGAVRARFGDVEQPGPRDPTMILRDLALALPQLSSSEQREAEALLARPADGASGPYGDGYTVASHRECGTDLCVHWVETTDDAPPDADGDGATVPAWVGTTRAVLEDVWQQEVVNFGYRAPKSDESSANNGGDGRLDVYLADVGAHGFFGYCTTDDPNASPGSTYAYFDFSAYCVVDNDFLDFGFSQTPQQFLEVTAAHEFFHAVQFAYDAAEDLHLMEGSATWIEDEVYDNINDNLRYARRSALARPGTPVDTGENDFEYGAWIFYRFVSEHFGDRDIVREIWANADGSATGRDDYSLRAITRAVSTRGAAFRTLFATFGRVNRAPARFYEEGSEYRSAPLSAKYAIGRTAPTTGWKTPRVRHLATRYYAFEPSRSARRTSKLRATVDLPRRTYGSAATLIVRYGDGRRAVRAIHLDRSGNGDRTVAFGRGEIARVELVLSNASVRFDPATQYSSLTPYSWGGAVPLDDSRKFKFRADLR